MAEATHVVITYIEGSDHKTTNGDSNTEQVAALNTRVMGWLRLVGSIKLQVSYAKEPYKRDDILEKRPIISSILLTVATP